MLKPFKNLICIVKFADGSIWENEFKRNTRLNNNLVTVLSKGYFNDFMSGKDEMSLSEIKTAFKEWVYSKEPIPVSVKFKFISE